MKEEKIKIIENKAGVSVKREKQRTTPTQTGCINNVRNGTRKRV